MKFATCLIAAILISVSCLLSGRRLLHLFQLESYQLPGYFRSVRRAPARTILPGVLLTVLSFAVTLISRRLLAPVIVLCAASLALFGKMHHEKAKKKFVTTERVKRFMAIHLCAVFVIAWILTSFCFKASLLLPALEPLLLALFAKIAEPVEKNISRQFVQDARVRLDSMPDLIRIGITGSYGKTSTKFLLRDILSVRFRVLATPSSFNTTMGVTRVIREQLTRSYDVFIAEMGARHVGDIAELVDLVHPTVGLLTSVGPQHLDTFGTIERVRDTKYELIAGLPEDGIAVFADDHAICGELYERCQLKKKYRAGDLLKASGIETGPWGTRFTLEDTATGETAVCTMKLLGEHSVSNILLCCTAARALGMTLQEIVRGVALCRPVEHRLQLLDGGAGMTIIDDAFNSNPVGSRAALDVLRQFPGRRIIVTPGMVELGEKEAEYNRAFGEHMAECADEVFLVGIKHTAPIAEGLRAKGFPEEHLHISASLDDSTALLRPMMQPGDVILYENDLPDNYTEA